MAPWMDSDRKCFFCFSVDVELSVVSDTNKRRPWADPKLTKRLMGQLLDRLRVLDIRATFAPCGHLFLDSCQGHPNHPKPSLFPDDPSTDQLADPGWYAPDLIEDIQRGGHEVACHSFSHISFKDPRCDPEVARFEIEECLRLAREMGLEFESFVFPRHEEAYHELLKASGFSAYVTIGRQDGRTALTHAPDLPSRAHGMLRVPRHVYLSRSGAVDQMKFGLKSLIYSRSGYCHVWMHDWNLVQRGMLNAVTRLLTHAQRLGYRFCSISDLVGEYEKDQ